MNVSWHKLGRLYVPSSQKRHPKLLSHAANPLPLLLHDDVFRIFFSARDSKNRSSVGAVDIDIVRREIIKEHYQPFFEHGPDNSFYADGVSIGNCYTVNGIRYMLFMGWQNPKNKHWRGSIGRLTVSPDLGLHIDTSDAPFMSLNSVDPTSLSYPWVLESDDGFRMWYGSTKTWDAGNGEMVHTIKSASSTDGHQWVREGTAIPYTIGEAQAFSRPTVAKTASGSYEMWFSYRSGQGETYRIGYATSHNGKNWGLALDAAGITVSTNGWDSEMIEYPYVFDHKNERYMLYNGNGYGKSGFGLAILERS